MDFFLDDLHSLFQRDDAALLLRTQLEFDTAMLKRTFTDYDTQRQADQVGIVKFDPGRLCALIKEHLDYYRLLASSPRSSADKRQKLALLEALEGKLAGTEDCD